MIRDDLQKIIRASLERIGLSIEGVLLERAEYPAHGDYATSVALSLAKNAGKNSRVLAEEIVAEIKKEDTPFLAKAEIAGPGFINFFLKNDVFTRGIEKIIAEKERYGKGNMLSGKKIMVEYTQPNPFKPFHIGHLMSNAIGESLSRIIELNGAQVIRANYQGDVGLHVAKAIWAIRKKGYDPKNIGALGDAYVFGNAQYEESEEAKNEIIAVNKHVYLKDDEGINMVYSAGRKTSLDHFEELYKKLGTTFDVYFFESETAGEGGRIVEEHLGSVFQKSDGAIIFPGEKYGLHNRVFITSEGIPTYEAKDIGLAARKLREYAPDISITITAVEQKEYFNVVFRAFTMIEPKSDGVFMHLSHGMMQLESGKMSSRKGNVITGESLIVEAEKRAKEKIKKEHVDDVDMLATIVGIAAIKYSILKQSIGKNIVFELESALSFEGDSGPYLQYTHARICSILRKAEKKSSTAEAEVPERLERLLHVFPEIVEGACTEYAPSNITTYLIELAQEFNSYYGDHKIIEHPYRLLLAEATAIVLKNGLALLGISAPEKM